MLRKLKGLIFISTKGIENSWPFQWYQLIPCRREKCHFRSCFNQRGMLCFQESVFKAAGQKSWFKSTENSTLVQLQSHSSPANPHHHENTPVFSLTPVFNRQFMTVHLRTSHFVSSSKKKKRYRAQREKQRCSKAFVVQPNHSFTQHLAPFVEPFQYQADRARAHHTCQKTSLQCSKTPHR